MRPAPCRTARATASTPSTAAAVVALVAACEQAGVSRVCSDLRDRRRSRLVGSLSSAPRLQGDKAVASSSLEWTILRPGLVIAPAAYGGTALLRALAAFPGFIPAVMARQPIQTVAVTDVTEAVSRAVAGSLPPRLCRRSRRSRGPLAGRRAGCLSGMARPATGRASCRCRPFSVGSRLLSPMALACLAGDRLCAAQRLAALARGVTGNAKSWSEISDHQAAAARGNAGRHARPCPGAMVRPALAAETGRLRRAVAVLAGLRHRRLYQARCGCRHSGLAWPVAGARRSEWFWPEVLPTSLSAPLFSCGPRRASR